MKNTGTETEKKEISPVFIADECGDTLWDDVLKQEVKACDVKNVSKNAAALLNNINTALKPLSAESTETGLPIA